jgi:hypothetical protein
MKNIFTIPRDLSSTKDDVLKEIKEALTLDFNFSSGLVFVKLQGGSSDFVSIRKELQEGEPSWGVLAPLIESMQKELKSFAQLFEQFYTTKSDYKTVSSGGLSPLEINHLINEALVRIKRMRCVLNPEFSIIDFQDKKTTNRYTMIKGYWIDDQGAKKRSFSRSISNAEASLEELIAKAVKSHIKNSVVIENDKSFNFRPDLIVADGENRWAVEIKLRTRESIIKTIVMLEMWKLYKQTYELIK